MDPLSGVAWNNNAARIVCTPYPGVYGVDRGDLRHRPGGHIVVWHTSPRFNVSRHTNKSVTAEELKHGDVGHERRIQGFHVESKRSIIPQI